jgi:hypothetical protein
MSPTSKSQLKALLGRARAAGMTPLELRRWQQILDPAELDTCGCQASMKTAVAVSVMGGLATLFAERARRRAALLKVLAAAATMAVFGKLLGQRRAQEQQSRLLATLTGRVQQLESGSARSGR